MQHTLFYVINIDVYIYITAIIHLKIYIKRRLTTKLLLKQLDIIYELYLESYCKYH